MDLGFFAMPIYPINNDPSLRDDREAFVLSHELGYSVTLCGDRPGGTSGSYSATCSAAGLPLSKTRISI
jgi:hypothetical protein